MLEALVDLVPVDSVPPCGEVIGSAVLVLEVVGMLPHIVAQDGVFALRERTVLVGACGDYQFAAVPEQPAPPGTKLFGSGFVEDLLESTEVAEVLPNLLSDFASGIAASAGLHDVPKHGVVDVAPAIISHSSADVLGDAAKVAEQVLSCVLREVRMLLNRSVEVVDVGLVMLVVVQPHSFGVDVGFECSVVVRKRRQFVGQGGSPSE